MNYATKGIETSEFSVLNVLTELKNGQIREAVDGFADQFKFTDYGIGLEFDDKERLTEFFQKTRELYPDSALMTDRILANGQNVATEWTLRYTVTEPFFGGLSRRVPVVSTECPSYGRATERSLAGQNTMTDLLPAAR